MRQILQDLRKGRTYIEDVPAPICQPGCLLVQTHRSLLSPGTERMLVEFAQAGLLRKARSQPDRVREVLNKIQTDGLLPTLEAVFAKLGEPLPLGYCNAGIVAECGDDRVAERFPVGARVATNGHHAEYVLVGANVAARIPEGVSDDTAAFTPLAAIGLQGIRLAKPTLGETVFVTGLGLIGLLTVQLLRANGCRVIGSDFRPERRKIARLYGCETVSLDPGDDPVAAAMAFTGGRGVDAVLITAATKSNEPVRQAAQMCRPRGRIVLVGVTGLELNRNDFYKKELSFQVSCSYGPGRYDEKYEQGQDYPLGHVRWTEQRNFEAVLQLMASGQLDVAPLLTHRFPFAQAESAYELIQENPTALGVVLEYASGSAENLDALRSVKLPRRTKSGRVRVGVVGAGAFTQRVILPALAKTGASLEVIASARGLSGTTAARRFRIANSTTDSGIVFGSDRVNSIFIATRHGSHAELVTRALASGKHVFVEKPLAVSLGQLRDVYQSIQVIQRERGQVPALMVGYNRRFSPHIQKIRAHLDGRKGPACMEYTINAGAVPRDSWIQDAETGGGRIIGELCHFIDTLRYLSGARLDSVTAEKVSFAGDGVDEDKLSVILKFGDGSLGTINYWANGPKSFPKERLLVMADGRACEMLNFRKTIFHQGSRQETFSTLRQDKGHTREIAHFVDALERGHRPAMTLEELLEVSLATFAIRESVRGGGRQLLSEWITKLREVDEEPSHMESGRP